LKTGDNGLQFSLRDQNAGNNAQRDFSPSNTGRIVVPDDNIQAAPEAAHR